MSTISQPPVNDDGKFIRGLGLLDSTMLVAGSMIGSGVFIVSADIARLVGSGGWLACGVGCDRRSHDHRRAQLR